MLNLLSRIKTKLFPPKQLCTVTFIYAIKPKYSSKASVSNCTKEMIAWIEPYATKADCTKIFADNSMNSNMTYQIKDVVITPIKTVKCSK